MAQSCICGYEVIVHITADNRITYCQNCGKEERLPRSGDPYPFHRVQIAKKMGNSRTVESKRPKQIRDKNNYVRQRSRR